jgi:hypothetical protein
MFLHESILCYSHCKNKTELFHISFKWNLQSQTPSISLYNIALKLNIALRSEVINILLKHIYIHVYKKKNRKVKGQKLRAQLQYCYVSFNESI